LHSVGQAVLLRLGGFILRYFYGGFILNLAAVSSQALALIQADDPK
jgi:hypothetical protein